MEAKLEGCASQMSGQSNEDALADYASGTLSAPTSSSQSNLSPHSVRPFVETLDKLSPQQEIRKKYIPFRVAASSARHNVDKFVIKSVLRFHGALQNEILREYKKVGYSEADLTLCAEKLDHLRKVEKVDLNAKTRTKRDYAHAINVLLSQPQYIIILKCCLTYSLMRLRDPARNHIKAGNLPVYETTIEDYLAYINSALRSEN